jgi:hypothetical protein
MEERDVLPAGHSRLVVERPQESMLFTALTHEAAPLTLAITER